MPSGFALSADEADYWVVINEDWLRMYRMDHLQAFIKESRSGFKVKETRSGINHNQPGQFSKAYIIPFIYLDECVLPKNAKSHRQKSLMIHFIDPRRDKEIAGLFMSEKRREPTFVYHTNDGDETLVGEFHYGSASDINVLAPGKGIKLFLTDPPTTLVLIMASQR